MIRGSTTLIAHIGYPTEAFKAPMIYNPWFEQAGIDAVVVPMGVKPEDYAASLRQIFRFTNLRGALVTMPHKVATMELVDEVTPTARIAGACNAVLLRPDGTPWPNSGAGQMIFSDLNFAVDNFGAGDVLEIERPSLEGKRGKRFMVPMRIEAVPDWNDERLVITAAFFMMRAAPGSPFDTDRRLLPEIEASLVNAQGQTQLTTEQRLRSAHADSFAAQCKMPE